MRACLRERERERSRRRGGGGEKIIIIMIKRSKEPNLLNRPPSLNRLGIGVGELGGTNHTSRAHQFQLELGGESAGLS